MPNPQYIKKVSTLLFKGNASDFGAYSTLLLDHRELVNHQVYIVSSGTLAAGKYKIRFIPDEDSVVESTVDTGEVLDMTAKDSAYARFVGMLKGIHLEVDTAFTAGETISVVVSSYSKVYPETQTYLSSQILDSQASNYGSFSATPDKHTGMLYHQLSLSSSGTLAAGAYSVRIIPDVDEVLETSVDIEETLDVTGANSGYVQFDAVMKGVDLQVATPLTGGEVISIILSSATEQFDTLVLGAIGGTGDHLLLTNIGSNSHVQIDAHIADSTLHFTEASIDHTAIANIGTNSHAAIDTHIADGTLHFTEASIDHTAIANIGTNTHAQIDTHLALTNEHIDWTITGIEVIHADRYTDTVYVHPNHSGDVTSVADGAQTIAANAVTFAKMQDINTNRFIGRDTAGSGDPEELTMPVATAMLNTFTTSLQGLAPSSGGGTTNYLRADGTWAAPPGGSASNSFETQTVTDTDAGYTWAATGSAVADSSTDTLTWVSGVGIDVDVDAALDAIRITTVDGEIVHDNLSGYLAAEHVDWAGAGAGTIHTDNYIENVPTALSTGTVTATTYGITSDSGTDDVVLVEATTTTAGLLGAAKWDEIVANTAKVTNATHTGQVTGATALSLDVTAITAQPASGAIISTDTTLVNDGGVLSESTFAQLDTYFNSSLSFSPTSHTHLLAAGATDVTAIAAELNVLDLSATTLTAGWVYKAIGVSSATWGELAGSEINNDLGWTTTSGTVLSVIGGVGVDSSGGDNPEITLDVAELSEKTGALVAADRMVVASGAASYAETISGIPLSIFNNDSGWTSNAGTVTAVTGGTGVSSTGGTTPDIALTVDELAEKTGAVVGTDRIVGTTGTTNWAETISGIPLSVFNNDSGWTSNAGTVTAVTGGTGLSSTGGTTPEISHDAHTGQVTGATALSLDVTAITAQPASGALVGTDTILTNDGGVLSESTMVQVEAYMQGELLHDDFIDYVANEHIDWTNATQNINTTGSGTFDGTVTVGDTVLTDDGFFHLSALSATSVALTADDQDYLRYDRATNQWEFFIGTFAEFELSATVADFKSNDIITTGALNAGMDSVFHTTDIATTDPLVEVIRGTTTAFTYDSVYSMALASKEAFVGMAFLQDKVTTPPDTNIAFGSSTNNWKAGITYDNDADLVNIWAGMDFVISGYDAGSWTQPRAYAGHWLGANVEGQAATESLRLDAVLYPLHVFGDGVGFSTMARFEQDSGLANAYVEVIADDNQWAGFTMKSQGGGNGGGVFYGGGTNGDKIQLYCDGGWINIHSALSATPRDLEFITSIGTELHYDDSASEWDFQANAITTTGSVTCGDFTSTGIDDTATTGERLQLADTLLTLGQSGASGYNIARVSETGALLVSGGASGSTGSNIRMFGASHSSSAYDFDFRSDTTVEMKFDYNLNQWEFKANDVLLNSGDLIIGTIGKGIDFSATADGSGTTDNEILDDYEEGTWTPTITDGVNNATLSLATGSYTKVGDIVTLRGRLTLSSKGSISGNLRLGGFPFSCQPNVAASMSTLHIGYCVGATITAGQSMAGYISNNNSYAFLRLWDASGGQTALQDTEVGNSLSLIFTALYTNDV